MARYKGSCRTYAKLCAMLRKALYEGKRKKQITKIMQISLEHYRFTALSLYNVQKLVHNTLIRQIEIGYSSIRIRARIKSGLAES